MKTFKYIFPFLATVVCMTGCLDDEDSPVACNIIVETQEAKTIGNTYAELSFKIPNGSNEGIYKTGILYSTDASLTNAQDEFEAGNRNSQFSRTIQSLKRNTTYYFKGYVEDSRGNHIEGKTLSFTTKNDAAKVVTGSGKQTGVKTFFINPTGALCYRFDYTIYSTLIGSDEVESWGINVYDSYTDKKHSLPVKEGVNAISFWVETTYSTKTYNYKAYAKLKNGSYIYGDIKSIYLHY